MATAYTAGASSMVAAISRPRLPSTSFHPRSSLPNLPPRPSSLSLKLFSGTLVLSFSLLFSSSVWMLRKCRKCKKPTLHSSLFMYKASVLLNCILVNCGLTCSGIFAPSIALSWILQTQKIRLMNDVGTG